ncbi:hypothetical protein MLD63_01355 (plasmid) [Paracoccus sp. TK19116]|uniref:Uncharacterized protein n=1 Tax=Paracoccus albicereus TaxID=2922394 RepID=A0ABT1MNB0_9RHOB|nr:hypothetical protein [Paracoccus albicereus]MCQ0969081.1 hypothetical protein [Paracoccus albicereus]
MTKARHRIPDHARKPGGARMEPHPFYGPTVAAAILAASALIALAAG